MFAPAPNSYAENLMNNAMVLEVWALWEVTGHEGGVLENGISALLQGPREPPSPSVTSGHSKKWPEPEAGPHQTPDLPPPSS